MKNIQRKFFLKKVKEFWYEAFPPPVDVEKKFKDQKIKAINK